MKSSSRIVLAALLMGAVLPLPAFAATCTTLTIDLGSGSNDKNSAGQVTRLQVYLKELGHLSATPNGNFGPATFAAVKAFQAANGVSATGFVGPATRGVIKAKSCPAAATPTQAPSVPASVARFSAPREGSVLEIGSSYLLAWDSVSSPRAVILEDAQGVAQGYIASHVRGASYQWRVGKVYSSATQRDEFVAPGEYRLRAMDEAKGMQSSDPISGVFTIKTKPFAVASVLPSSVAADDRTSIVIYGDGFDESTQVFLDDRQSEQLSRRYVSDDGKVLVMTAPTGASIGTRALYIRNGHESFSGKWSITIVSP